MATVRTRPTTGQRGYGLRHKQERLKWTKRVNAGLVNCARCQEPIEAGSSWDLGHNDERTGWTGPEHASCNRRAGGSNGAKVANALRGKQVRQSRAW
jgi:hypothetical protein